jgi:hypothetical protein
MYGIVCTQLLIQNDVATSLTTSALSNREQHNSHFLFSFFLLTQSTAAANFATVARISGSTMNCLHVGALQRLLILLLPVLVVALVLVPIRSEDQLPDDALELKEELEKYAEEKLLTFHDLVSDGRFDEAEDVIRDSIASAPWISDAHRSLAHFLLDHHEDKKQVHDILYHFHSAMRIENKSSDRFPRRVYPARLRHDRDQLVLLGERGKIQQSIVDRLVEEYDEFLSKIPYNEMSQLVTLPWDFWPRSVGSIYDWALNVPEIEPLKGPALNPSLDFAAIEEQYLSSDPQFANFDDFLTEEALLRLRKYYEEATIFWDSIGPGYVGTYINDGFGNPVIGQLIEELIDAFPRIICSHRLNMAWVSDCNFISAEVLIKVP